MDFQGQKLAETLLVRIIVLFGVVSFLAGFATSDFMLMVYMNAAGLLLACAVVLPDWPWYRRHPVKWLPALHPEPAAADTAADVGESKTK